MDRVLNSPRFVIAVAVVFSLQLHPSDVFSAFQLRDIIKTNLEAVPTIIALDKEHQSLALGSGFFIDRKGSLVTNGHVVGGAEKVAVRWKAQTGEATRISRFNSSLDLVVLDTTFKDTPAVGIGDSDLVTVGDEIVVLGNPLGLEGTASTGIISGLRVLEKFKFLQITAPISPGSSGGPVIDLEGHVIGVATATLSKGQNLNFALAINTLSSLQPSSLTFQQLRWQQPKRSPAPSIGDSVRATNIVPNRDFDDLRGATFSIFNGTDRWIEDVRALIVFYNYRGQPIEYSDEQFTYARVPPKLATQVHVSTNVVGYSNYFGGGKSDGRIEVRILDYRIVPSAPPVTERGPQKR